MAFQYKSAEQILAEQRDKTTGDKFKGVFDKFGQYTSGFDVANTGMSVQRTEEYNPYKGNIERATDFAKSIAGSVGTVVRGTPGFISNHAKNVYSGVEDFAEPVAKWATSTYNKDIEALELQRETIEKRMEAFTRDYNSGKMSRETYKQAQQEAAKEYSELAKQGEATVRDLKNDSDRVISGAIDTAIVIVSAGSYASIQSSLAKSTSKSFYQPNILSKLMTGKTGEALKRLEDLSAKIPSVKALMVRNGAVFANTSRGVINQSLRDAAVGAMIKQPFVYHYNVEDIKDIFEDIYNNEVGGSTLGKVAFTLTEAFNGGIFGMAQSGMKKGKLFIADKVIGRESLLDNLSASLKDADPKAWKAWLDAAKTPKARLAREKTLRIFQEMNLQHYKEGGIAVDNLLYHISSNGAVDPKNITFAKYMQRETKFLKRFEEATALAKAGKLSTVDGAVLKEAHIALGTFDNEAKQSLLNNLKKYRTNKERMEYVNSLWQKNIYWTQNEVMYNRVMGALANEENPKIFGKKIMQIKTTQGIKGLSKKMAKEFADDGYIIIAPKNNRTHIVALEDTRALITGYIDKGDEFYQAASKPITPLHNLYGALNKLGISPEANNKIAYKHLVNSVTSNLDNLKLQDPLDFKKLLPKWTKKDMNRGGEIILEKLQNYAESKSPSKLLTLGGLLPGTNAITDIRQLTLSEIQDAISSSAYRIARKDASKIREAVMDGYLRVPLELRGAGDRFVDKMFKHVPFFQNYNRAQSALRYTYNPFFRYGQEIPETKILSKMQGGNLLWGLKKVELDDVAKQLDKAKFFSTGFSGEGAQNANTIGRITASITQTQKRDLAGLAATIAKKRGVDLSTMIANHSDELDDILRVVVQYPSKGVLNSPLARTLNLAFFPARYNLKVAGLAAKFIGTLPPTMQYATVKGIIDATEWMKSDEGILWQSQNAEAIGLLKWLTPYGSVESVFNNLNLRPDSISDIGLMGGLPAGVIFQILDSQGVFNGLPGGIKYSTPYVNPKTGEVYKDKIPASLKGATATALGDFLGSTFTYPGRILGLPGKGDAVRWATGQAIKTNSKDYEYIEQYDKLTDLQKRQSDILQNKDFKDMTDDDIVELYRNPIGPGYGIPNLPLLVGMPKLPPSTKKAKSTKPKAKVYAKPTRSL